MPTTKRIDIDVSSDIANKVISFLENLPKGKVKIKYKKSSSDKDILLETSGLLNNKAIDPMKWQEEIRGY